MGEGKDRSLFLKCTCHGEGLGVDYEEEDHLYYFSYWKQGFSNGRLGWKERIRYAWNVLRKGKPFNDEIILNQQDVDNLIDFLLGYKRLPKEKMDKLMKVLNAQFKNKNKK